MASATVLVTGGAGYIGSHCIVELLVSGYDVIAVDNFANALPGKDGGMPESLRRVSKLAGKSLLFEKCDLCDEADVETIFTKYKFQCVMHFAALKAVGASCDQPLEYYRNNVGGTVCLLNAMKKHGLRNIVFSSSATVYGVPEYLPVDEKHPTGMTCTNPYGRTKYFIEEMLKDLHKSEVGWNMILLRYFNPVGAHKSGMIGEDPKGEPNNLMPYISQVAVGRRDRLKVFGQDFDTSDGTGVRDYIHVVDLAQGHLAALNKQLSSELEGLRIYNLGASKGYSVLEVVEAFEKASGRHIAYDIVEPRNGDVASLYADATLAEAELKWRADRSLLEMCQDTWRWQKQNPRGFDDVEDHQEDTKRPSEENGVH